MDNKNNKDNNQENQPNPSIQPKAAVSAEEEHKKLYADYSGVYQYEETKLYGVAGRPSRSNCNIL